MITDPTWSSFATLALIAVSAFCAGRLWEYDKQQDEIERRAQRRRAYRYHPTNQGDNRWT